MSTLLWILLISGIAGIAASATLMFMPTKRDSYSMPSPKYPATNGLLWAVVIVAALSVFVFGLISSILYGSRAVGRETCRNWSEQTGYQTKFRILNWSDTGTCLARTSGGRWVKNTSVIINVPEKP